MDLLKRGGSVLRNARILLFLKYPDSFKIQILNMCIYTVKKQNFKKIKNFFKGACTPPNVPKFGVSGVKDTAKTNKD